MALHARCKNCRLRQAQTYGLCRRCWRGAPVAAAPTVHFRARGDAAIDELRPIILPHEYQTRVVDGVEYVIQFDGT